MILQLTLPVKLEERLRQEAARHGQPSEAVACCLLDAQHLPPPDERRAAALALLNQWMEEDSPMAGVDDDDEFFRNLDASRTSNRPLFPPELKGITW